MTDTSALWNSSELRPSAITKPNHGRDAPDQAEWHPSPVQDPRAHIQASGSATKHTPNFSVSRIPPSSLGDRDRDGNGNGNPAEPQAPDDSFPRPTSPRARHDRISAGCCPVPRSIVTAKQGFVGPRSNRQYWGGGKAGAERGRSAVETGKRRSTINSGPSVELSDYGFTSPSVFTTMDLCCRHARAWLRGGGLDYGRRGRG